MPLDADFKLGPFAVGAEGRLALRDPDATPDFLFRWRGRPARARLHPPGAGDGRLALRGVLGRVPSTGTRCDPALRAGSFAALRWMQGAVPTGWRLSLLPDHRVLLDAELRLPATASGLLVAVTGFLLALAPYLDLLDELGMGEGASAAGMAKT